MFDRLDMAAPRPVLSTLAEIFGARLVEASASPALLSVIDQHAAAVRDGLSGGVLEAEILTDYVLGFTDALREIGWTEPLGYDFATERLTAVCRLADEHGMLGEDDPVS
jgi:hypothetical protein